MKRLAVIDVVGLTQSLIGPHTPDIARFLKQGAKADIVPAFPAVTCTAQSNYLTGATPAAHGVVGNGWYHRELAEVQFWKQSDHLVNGPKIWDELRALEADLTCAKLFWWFNMYSSADYSITPRPIYPADGRKVFDIYTWPYSIRAEIKTGPKRIWATFHFRLFGGLPRASIPPKVPPTRRLAGSRIPRNGSKTSTNRRSALFTCRISTTTCRGMGRSPNPPLTPPGRGTPPTPRRRGTNVPAARYCPPEGGQTPPFTATSGKSTPSSAI